MSISPAGPHHSNATGATSGLISDDTICDSINPFTVPRSRTQAEHILQAASPNDEEKTHLKDDELLIAHPV